MSAGACLAPGDLVRGMESGWFGVIVASVPDPHAGDLLDDCGGYWKVRGLDRVLFLVMGRSFSDSLCDDDVQWFHGDDLELLIRQVVAPTALERR